MLLSANTLKDKKDKKALKVISQNRFIAIVSEKQEKVKNKSRFFD